MSRRKSKTARVRATLDVRPSPEQIEAARIEGKRQAEQKTDAAIDQVRADAQALETAARLLDDAPRNVFPVPHKAETVSCLFALAAGLRLAADRMPDSREIPF